MKVFRKKRIFAAIVILAMLIECNLSVLASDTEPVRVTPRANENVQIYYSAHLQKKGWTEEKKNGERLGTTGSSLRLEALKINVSNIRGLSGDVLYRSHVQTYGWEQDWKKNGELSGTSGQAKRLEAVQIKLTGELAEKYDVYYRTHVQTYGWLEWAKNGACSGSSGYSKRIEAIEIVLTDKGTMAPGADQYSYMDSSTGIGYTTHVQTYGWQEEQKNGNTAGTSGLAKRLESIQIQLLNQRYEGAIEYQSHVQTYGWEQDWKQNGEKSGTEGQHKRLEAIRIRLTGKLAEKCDVYYRVHTQHFGWLGWVKNGDEAGTSGFSYRMEAIQILLLPKHSRIFPETVGYIAKDTPTVETQWNLSEIMINPDSKEYVVNTPMEMSVQAQGEITEEIVCSYTWTNYATGEQGIIGDTGVDGVLSWTPENSGTYMISMTARSSEGKVISREKNLEVIHGSIHREDAFFTAHMGLSAHAPANSIPAFIMAGEYGFDSIEADVNETKDGVFVISHDNNLLNICGVDKNISDMQYEEMKNYEAYHITNGANVEQYSNYELRLPTLEEYLDICIQYGCSPQIDVKNLNSFESVMHLYSILKGYGVKDQVIVTSFDNLYLQLLREQDPEIVLTYGVGSTQYLDVEWLQNYNIGASVQYSNLLSGDLDGFLDRNININAYTVNDKKVAGILLEHGINSITTDTVLWE